MEEAIGANSWLFGECAGRWVSAGEPMANTRSSYLTALSFSDVPSEKCSCAAEVFVCLLYKTGLSESRIPFFVFVFLTAPALLSCSSRTPANSRVLQFSGVHRVFRITKIRTAVPPNPGATVLPLFRTAALVLFTEKRKNPLYFPPLHTDKETQL